MLSGIDAECRIRVTLKLIVEISPSTSCKTHCICYCCNLLVSLTVLHRAKGAELKKYMPMVKPMDGSSFKRPDFHSATFICEYRWPHWCYEPHFGGLYVGEPLTCYFSQNPIGSLTTSYGPMTFFPATSNTGDSGSNSIHYICCHPHHGASISHSTHNSAIMTATLLWDIMLNIPRESPEKNPMSLMPPSKHIDTLFPFSCYVAMRTTLFVLIGQFSKYYFL